MLEPIYEMRDAHAEDIYAREESNATVNEPKKFDELEWALSKYQWLSGGNFPDAADAEAYEAVLQEKKPDADTHLHLFAWYAMISKFTPSKLASLKWDKEKVSIDITRQEELLITEDYIP